MNELNAEMLRDWLVELCAGGDRHVGGRGNRLANDLFERAVREFGFEVEREELPCLVWEHDASAIWTRGEDFEILAGPYSPPCEGRARLAAAGTVEELERGHFERQVLLVHGELVREPLMPKNFVFYNPEGHQRIVRALEAASPLAVIAATGKCPELSGGLYPFPLVDDGDFELPSAYLKDVDGERLRAHVGEEVAIQIASRRRAATTPQIIARKRGRGQGRIVFFGHIDTKSGTPGALDNASGVATLLGIAKLLADYRGPHAVEIVPLNGEDYYAATGQMRWLARNEGWLRDIVVGFNVDGAGYVGEGTPVSFYGCPEAIRGAVLGAMRRSGFVEGEPWPQGDHSILAFNGVPAVAVTSENAFFIASTVAHTARDTPDLVDPEILVRVARFFADAVESLGGRS